MPIVFTLTPDPVGAGFVDSLARPGGNVTGFTNFEFGIGVKWLELLKEIAPRVTRAAVLRDPTIPAGIGEFGAIQAVAPSVGIELRPIDVREAGEIERAVTAFARSSNNGLIVSSNALASVHRNLIVTLAARHRLPAVYPFRFFVTIGGLASYGPDTIDPHHRAAGYVDRILKGEKPADLPVQAPTKYELMINLKRARHGHQADAGLCKVSPGGKHVKAQPFHSSFGRAHRRAYGCHRRRVAAVIGNILARAKHTAPWRSIGEVT